MVATWDIVAQNYLNKGSDTRTTFKPVQQELNHSICERLYNDFIRRKLQREEFLRQQKVERDAQIARESRLKYVDRTPNVNAEFQHRRMTQLDEENEKVGHHLRVMRDLENERSYLESTVSIRRVAHQVKLHESDPLLVELTHLGCPTQNAIAVNTLFSLYSRDEIEDLIAFCKEARENQKMYIAGEEEIRLYEERRVKEELQSVIEEELEKVLQTIMDREGLLGTDLMEKNEEGRYNWCGMSSLHDLVKRRMKEYMIKHSGVFEELVNKRRRILAETILLYLQNLISILQLDVRLRTRLHELRIGKLQIRGYRYDLVESLKGSSWFKDHMGSTSSLRNNFIIKKSIRDMINAILETKY